ncbi:1,2-phenylacetyl-CoA epoxidase subunit B, partial [Streptomyces albidoflavus]
MSETPTPATESPRGSWPLYEIFVRGKRGLNHVHHGARRPAHDPNAQHNPPARDTPPNQGGTKR